MRSLMLAAVAALTLCASTIPAVAGENEVILRGVRAPAPAPFHSWNCPPDGDPGQCCLDTSKRCNHGFGPSEREVTRPVTIFANGRVAQVLVTETYDRFGRLVKRTIIAPDPAHNMHCIDEHCYPR